ncbi:MAG: hypothetical protein AAB724_00055 [Patescibacteria group bacterium]
MTANLFNTAPIKASTQDHLDVVDIVDDLVIFKDGSAAMILETTAVNFGLLSEAEQDAIIYGYAQLLNSLSFPVQIFVKSQKMNITNYVETLKTQEQKQLNEKMRQQITRYRAFIESVVKENKVLDKKFYLILGFSSLEMGLTAQHNKKVLIEKAKTVLSPRKDHLLRQMARVGLKIKVLSTQSLVELFYNLYNSEFIGSQKLLDAKSYTVPLVTPAITKQGAK